MSLIFVLLTTLACLHVQAGQDEGCKDLGPIEHGWHNLLSDDPDQVESQLWLPGTKITYTCEEGMIIKGEASHVCTKSGWQPGLKPTCERISCEAIEVKHGIVTTRKVGRYLPEDTISILCDDGYQLRLNGQPYTFSDIVCDKFGHWNAYDETGDLPICEAVLCNDPPLIEHATSRIVDPHGNSEEMNMEGARAYYYCDYDYKLTDKAADILKCENGQWVGKYPECLKKINIDKGCPEPEALLHGYFSVYGGPIGEFMLDGTKIYYKCEDGYILHGESVRECTDSQWVSKAPTCKKERTLNKGCPLPHDIENGGYRFLGDHDTQSTGLIAEGSEVFYDCHTGYRFSEESGSHNIVCRDQKWQGDVPKCVARTDCDAPQQIKNGHWIILGFPQMQISNKYTIGTKILYECDSDYRPNGATILECQGEGYWSEYPPRCLPKDLYCEDPGEVENGYYVCEPSPTHCDLFKVGVRIQYICNPSHLTSGAVEQMCLSGGKWSATKPVCKSESTTSPALSMMRVNSNTLTIVIATSCSVLGLLLIVMVVMALQRRKPHPRLCHPVPPPPAPYPDPRAVATDEHDRVALIAFADGVQVVLPTYEEATRGSSHRCNMPRFPEPPGRRSGDYRPLPTIPTVLRNSRNDTSPHPGRLDNHRSSIITTTSTTTRDNMSLAFGSIDTMNVSDGTSTTVTVDTYDSAASNPSIATSQRATAGSLGSANSNGSVATEDAPLLEQSNRSDSNHILNNSICESSSVSDSLKQDS